MRLSILLFLCIISLSVAAQDVTKTKKVVQPVKKSAAIPLAADDKDPVCFMKVKKGTLITSMYKGTLYGFCSEHCKSVFLANPEEQLKPVVSKTKKS